MKKIILPETPPAALGALFSNSLETLYVPTEESKAAYESATNWARYAGKYVVRTPEEI
jgi:hypothetical protein